MIAAMYDHGRNAFARGDVAWKKGGSTIGAFLVTVDYRPDLENDEFLSSIKLSQRMGEHGLSEQAPSLTLLDGKGGICAADDLTFHDVPAGHSYAALVLFLSKDKDEDSPLLAYVDNIIGLPVTGKGADIHIRWHADGLFKL